MNVQDFIERWSGPHKESQDSHLFIIELLQLLGDTDPHQHVQFEKDVEIKALVKKKGKRGKRGTIEERLTTKHIDAYFPGTQVLLEMKSTGVDLDRLNSGEGYSSAFDQAKTYYDGLSFDEKGRWIVLSNFHEIRIHDMNEPNSAPRIIPLERLGRHLKELKILVNPKLTDIPETHIRKERDLSIEAGELVGVLYQAMLGLFDGDPTKEELKNLNILIVRLVFCFYADDAELFEPDQFHDFLVRYRNRPEDLSRDLMELFRVLDTPVNERNKRYMRADLYAFPYVNGGLFAQKIQIPQLSEEILDLILDDCSEGFRWDKISPTIFGALFESTLNPVDRREGGMHYTSIENIHKVIDLLFLDDPKAELERIKSLTSKKARIQQAKELQDRMAQLRFLDPACGSGNFLTESYISLRRIENELLVLQRERMYQKDLSDDVLFVNMTLVSIQQFYGIEINDFAVAVATTALYIAEAQMFKETEKLLSTDFEFLPLRSYTNIREGDALTMNWNDVIPAKELNYIMGNPPFAGARVMTSEQKRALKQVFRGSSAEVTDLDFVSGWYYKAWQMMMENPSIETAFVSTKSICQGMQSAALFSKILKDGIGIQFAYKPFLWDSEAAKQAQVHCVIVGLGKDTGKPKEIHKADGTIEIAENINNYLMDYKNIFIKSRTAPIGTAHKMGMGVQPVDDNNYLFTESEMLDFIKLEPKAKKYFYRWFGSKNMIQDNPYYCLWLGDCSPSELRQMPHVLKKVQAVKDFRLLSNRKGTRKLAETPTKMAAEFLAVKPYLIIPRHTSQRRDYIPMMFGQPGQMAGDSTLIIPDADIYDFGILESSVHMGWMRTIAGRIRGDYRYSSRIVYNNFPWPEITEQQKKKIEKTAQAILDARAKFPDASLADLYDPLTMPAELRKAHEANDKAVKEAYGFSNNLTEPEIVEELMKLYSQKISE